MPIHYYLGVIQTIFLSLINIVVNLIAVAYFTLAERKTMASYQHRKGPNVVGI
jgi:NADH:ubiquinone oxidoreductase subunit H